MKQGKWSALVKDVNDEPSSKGPSSKVGHLKHHDRHQAIIRERLIACLAGATQSDMLAGAGIHEKIGREVDAVLEAIVENASKDGLDLDGELLDSLSLIAANLFAIQLKWQEIKQLLNQST
jgi:hypothetical protein